MAVNAARTWIVTYDITDPKRLVRLHRFLKYRATPVQYSVFLFEGTTRAMGNLMADIEDRIHPDRDDVRAYQLPEALSVDTLGRGSMPAGTFVVSADFEGMKTLLGRAAADPTPDDTDKSV